MAKMTPSTEITEANRDNVRAMLERVNPTARPALIVQYLDSMIEYATAQANIREHGAIVFHPKTGAPIDNPYLAVRDRAGKRINDLNLRTEPGWW